METSDGLGAIQPWLHLFVRFGSFETFISKRNGDLKMLLDHVLTFIIRRLLEGEKEPGVEVYLIFRVVTHRTAELIAKWMSVGFVMV